MFPLCRLSKHFLCSHIELMLANFVVLSYAAVLLSRKKILRQVILKPQIHTAASRLLTTHCFLNRSKSLFPFRLVMLQKSFQPSPAVIGVVSGLVDPGFVHLFKGLFEQLIVTSLSNHQGLQQSLTALSPPTDEFTSHRPVLFLCLLEAMSQWFQAQMGQACAEIIYSFQPETNERYSVYMVYISLLIWISKGYTTPLHLIENSFWSGPIRSDWVTLGIFVLPIISAI